MKDAVEKARVKGYIEGLQYSLVDKAVLAEERKAAKEAAKSDKKAPQKKKAKKTGKIPGKAVAADKGSPGEVPVVKVPDMPSAPHLQT